MAQRPIPVSILLQIRLTFVLCINQNELLSCLQGEPLTEKSACSKIEHRRSAFWWLERHQNNRQKRYEAYFNLSKHRAMDFCIKEHQVVQFLLGKSYGEVS